MSMNGLVISLALMVVITIIIAVGIYFKAKDSVSDLKEETLDLKLKISHLEQDLEKQKKRSFRRTRIFEELLIVSQIGYKPSDKEKLKMMQMLIEDKKFFVDMYSKINYYKTDAQKEVAGQLNLIGKELIEICDDLNYSLSESITDDKASSEKGRSLYQEFVDYFYNYGFSFCGKNLSPGW